MFAGLCDFYAIMRWVQSGALRWPSHPAGARTSRCAEVALQPATRLRSLFQRARFAFTVHIVNKYSHLSCLTSISDSNVLE